jgi:hypothetical protein
MSLVGPVEKPGAGGDWSVTPPRGARIRVTRRRVIVGVVFTCIVTVGLVACSSTNTGIGRLTADGQVDVTPPHGVARPAHSGDILRAGDQVVVVAGDAAIRLLPNGVIQMRVGTHLTVNKTPRLTSGSILIEPTGTTVRVFAQDATLVVPDGVAQLTVGSITTGLISKVYMGTSQLDIPGNPPAPIKAPRQIILTPETRLPVEALPIQYQDSDLWDHLYLSEAETISSQLAAAATGFNAQVPASEGDEASFYQQLLPGLDGQPNFASDFETIEHEQLVSPPAAQPGAYLIASVIALRASAGTFEDRLSGGLIFFSQGAPWGLVGYDQGVMDLPGVLNDVLAAIGRATLPITGAPASQIAIGPPPAVGGAAPHTGGSPTTTTPATSATTPAGRNQPASSKKVPPPAITPLPVPVLPGALGSLLDPLLDPLIQALDNILSGKG